MSYRTPCSMRRFEVHRGRGVEARLGLLRDGEIVLEGRGRCGSVDLGLQMLEVGVHVLLHKQLDLDELLAVAGRLLCQGVLAR
eukprot:scaffold100490_cov59-Phaeocystis_antarctica.AAC.3